ncbi:MAG: 50S ribosomal protein L17 [Dehalococcoidia bacterium]|nr:50S ribosomal protein L17 [Dehalococcoidia bacterium]
MRHGVAGRKFDMPTSQRLAMFRVITTAVIRDGGVRTTEARAKEAQALVDKMITLGKAGTVHARRQALAAIDDRDVVQQLFDDVAPKYAERHGGYTRVIKLGQRKGDASRIARLELV